MARVTYGKRASQQGQKPKRAARIPSRTSRPSRCPARSSPSDSRRPVRQYASTGPAARDYVRGGRAPLSRPRRRGHPQARGRKVR